MLATQFCFRQNLLAMQNIQDSHFDCFDLSSRLAHTDDGEDWIACPHILIGNIHNKSYGKGSAVPPRSKPLASQDDCINKNLHPRLFTAPRGEGKAARRAAYNFHIGLSKVMDACRQTKSAKCLPTYEDQPKIYSDIQVATEHGDDDMWYFHP